MKVVLLCDTLLTNKGARKYGSFERDEKMNVRKIVSKRRTGESVHPTDATGYGGYE